jgi:uncharacterized protein (TIGR02246 family)
MRGKGSPERLVWRALIVLAALSATFCIRAAIATDSDEQMKVVEAIDAAWSAGDIQAMVDLHTEDAEYINAGSGHHWRGRDEMLRGWTAVRATSGPLPAARVRNHRQLTPETAVIVSVYDVTMPGRGSAVFLVSCVLVKHGEK